MINVARTILKLIAAILFAIAGVVSILFAYSSSDSRIKAFHLPQTMTARELIANGPGENAFVRITDFRVSSAIWVESEKTTYATRWHSAWIPIGPSGEFTNSSYRILLKTKFVNNDSQLDDLSQREAIEGTVINAAFEFSEKEKKSFGRAFPSRAVDLEHAWIVDIDRRPLSKATILLNYLRGAGLLLVSVYFVWWVLTPTPSEDIDEEMDEDEIDEEEVAD